MGVGRFHSLLPILRFESFDDEVTAGHVLKMVDEEDVDGGAGGCTDHRQRLRGGLFGNDHAEARGDRANKSSNGGRSFIDHSTATNMSCRITERLAKRGTDRPV